MSEDSVGGAAPEEWTLDHPELGEIRVYAGSAQQLRAFDPGFPEGEEAPIFPTLLVLREGVPVARYKQLEKRVIPLATAPEGVLKEGEYTVKITTPSRPRLRMETGFMGRWIKAAYVESAPGEVVDMVPPPGSKAEKYYRAMQESPWKRLVYPLVGGMGKAGWAIGVLVLGPLISRFIKWLLSFFPDVSLPSIPLPDVSLPSIPWPNISLPSIPWPDIPWPEMPDITLPDWVLWLLEHNKIWIPLVLGLVVGVISLRRAKKARETRQRWEA
ncbi:hypothetical protein [Corynebacterium lowii]|uniref:Uncharacterized protein n=1 Tax=Corynebacterium lowii TaxID=1544413 RepID=A0A0Q0U4P9_9CORY|nr:hypothetical protein [Corynebacterium lowii]KQB86933.1 hypothetical protein Clow_01144 [Corynebacterium lowii]MDP9851622.1 hypothetical protein [Corynebacterium lowii]